MTILGLGSYGVAWQIGVVGYEAPPQPLDAEGLVILAKSLGLKLVQYADNLPLHLLSENELIHLREESRALDVAIEVGTRGLSTAHMQRYIEIATYFGSPILRVVVDTKDHHPSPDEVVELINALLPSLESAGITLAIENHDRFKVRTLAGIIEKLNNPHVGICLDTVNSFGSAEGPEVVLQVLGRYVVNLHVKEFIVQRADHNMGFYVTGAPAGQGLLDIPWLLATLKSEGRSFNAIIENWAAPEATMTETVVKEADWVRQSVNYLRPLLPD